MTGASRYVLDASAVLSLVKNEPGSDRVGRAMRQDAALSVVNLSEVVAKLADDGLNADAIDRTIRASISGMVEIVDFDRELAVAAGLLRAKTRDLGLSLGDRACLALAMREGATALTADRAWDDLDLDVEIEVVR